MANMFCYQCEQAAKGTGCTMSGVCGKQPLVAHEQDLLTSELISLATAAKDISDKTQRTQAIDLIVDGLFTTITNVNFDAECISALEEQISSIRHALGVSLLIEPDNLFTGSDDLTSLRSTLLFGLRGMAAYAHHARVLGLRDDSVDEWFLKGMSALAESHTVEEWLSLLMEFGQVNLQCMALLDKANTETYGDPTPTQVPLLIEKGPFIVVTGHDLKDLKMLLEQTEGKGINIYTHSEMLPAHGYPELNRYPHLKGNFGIAWQNQQKEFTDLPAPILFTTNCLMTPTDNYLKNVYTTSVVGFSGATHIGATSDGHKDFTPIINRALELGGYPEDVSKAGLNGGTILTTGFGRKTLLDNAGAIIDAVKSGTVRHFFLVGGCDGAKPGRNYYTEFVKQSPKDTLILTLACGKYRFNDWDAGSIGPFPRILDVGQCNDAYGAIQVAVALAGAFECGVNDLPLTLVLSWYEQKAVCILLTLLSLGIKNIYLGPSLPAFFTPNVITTLVNMFDLHPITTPEQDLATILK